jgi:hypothetical protein
MGELLIEEHTGPAALAEQYANVIRLRIKGLPNRHLKCELVDPIEVAYASDRRD